MVLRRTVLILGLAALSATRHAQTEDKLPRIGFISGLTPAAMQTRVQAFRQGLRELGYVEGKNIIVEYLWGQEPLEARNTDALVAKMIALKPRVVVTAGPGTTRRFKERSSLPVVMAIDPDPLGSGFVASLARPGGNITGLSSVGPEVSTKQVDILKQILPSLSHIAILGESREPGSEPARREIETAARKIGAQTSHVDLRDFKLSVEDAFAGLPSDIDAMIILTNAQTVARKAVLARLAVKARLPVMYPAADFVDEGGLITYSANIEDLFRRSASYVDKILKGSRPGDLAVEQPYKFDLVINLRAAQDIGLKIPVGVLSRADRVIQ